MAYLLNVLRLLREGVRFGEGELDWRFWGKETLDFSVGGECCELGGGLGKQGVALQLVRKECGK